MNAAFSGQNAYKRTRAGQRQPRPQGLLAFQNGGGSGEDPGTQQNHVTKISNEDGNVFKMAAKRRSGYEILRLGRT